MPKHSPAGHTVGAVGTQPLYVFDAQKGRVDLGAKGGGIDFIGPTGEEVASVATVGVPVPGIHQWTRSAGGVWERSRMLSSLVPNKLHCSELGYLASVQAISHEDWFIQGIYRGESFFREGAVVDAISPEGSFAYRGIATEWNTVVMWSTGRQETFQGAITPVFSRGDFLCWQPEHNPNQLLVTTPSGPRLVQTVDDRVRPGVVFEDDDKQLWLWYTTDHYGHVCHRFDDPSVGYQWKGGDQFGQVVRRGDKNSVVFIWCISAGETVESLSLQQNNLDEDMFSITPVTDDTGLPIPPMPSFDRFMLTGPFFASDMYGSWPTPGNCELLLHTGGWNAMLRKRPVWSSAHLAPGVPNEMYLGGFASAEGGLTEGSPEADRFAGHVQIERDMSASKGGRGMLVNWDGPIVPSWFVERFVRKGIDIPCIEAYPSSSNETIDDRSG